MNRAKKQTNSEVNLKKIPSVQELLDDDSLRNIDLALQYKKKIIQRVIQNFRENIIKGELSSSIKRESLKIKILNQIRDEIAYYTKTSLRRIINGTGIILHTNLGRAPIAQQARDHLKEVIENYCNLEINLDSGNRGNRISIVEDIICMITGAEAAVVTNNNAAAILLALNSLCRRKEVPVSRGELVEIGGSFRMPDVMKTSGAKMVEVGTTNKTHLKDYENAINEKTACILKVHTSNYRVLGFTQTVSIDDLTALAHRFELPVIYDMGSGVIEDLQNWGYSHEPVAREYIEAGVDVITFSADKILGGPQAGIIIGKEKYLRKIKKNHLLRALRCDKLTYALLDTTLRLYLNPDKLPQHLPVAEMLNLTTEELEQRGKAFLNQISDLSVQSELVRTFSQMGSGALPLEKIPSIAIKLLPENMSVNQFAKKLRLANPGIVGYIEKDAFHLNLRTIRKDEIQMVTDVLRQVFV